MPEFEASNGLFRASKHFTDYSFDEELTYCYLCLGVSVMDLWLQDYTLEPIKNIGNRQYSSCAQVKNKKGQVLIAVASGYSKGLEIWNPQGNKIYKV